MCPGTGFVLIIKLRKGTEELLPKNGSTDLQGLYAMLEEGWVWDEFIGGCQCKKDFIQEKALKDFELGNRKTADVNFRVMHIKFWTKPQILIPRKYDYSTDLQLILDSWRIYKLKHEDKAVKEIIDGTRRNMREAIKQIAEKS